MEISQAAICQTKRGAVRRLQENAALLSKNATFVRAMLSGNLRERYRWDDVNKQQ